MGLLDKRNPLATPRSATLWACAGAIPAGIAGLAGFARSDMPTVFKALIVASLTILGGLIAWAVEWQLDDGD
jgi:hypothetical protein